MIHQIIIAGFGGQGVMSMGQILTYAGMLEGKEVSWLPSYGPEMRGGTANCNVIVSEQPVGSPIVTKASAAIVMNRPSLEKFENSVALDGMLFVNTSLIDQKASRKDIQTFYIPANDVANQLGESRIANMVILGAFLEKAKAVQIESVLESLKKVLGPSKEHLIPINRRALEEGSKSVL